MIKVIKRDGRLEDFSMLKLLRSINNSADDINAYFSEKDLELIGVDIERLIKEIRKDGSPTSSYEIRGIVVGTLYKSGFRLVSDSYCGGRMKK